MWRASGMQTSFKFCCEQFPLFQFISHWEFMALISPVLLILTAWSFSLVCVCGGVRGGLLMPVWVHLETRVRCHMSYPAPLHLVPLRYSISLTLKLGWWTVNPTGLPVNCYIWFFPLFRFYCTCVCVCLYIHVSACSCRGQKKTLDSLQLEL